MRKPAQRTCPQDWGEGVLERTGILVQRLQPSPILGNSRNLGSDPSPAMMCVHPAKEQNATQTILSLVSEGYRFSVSNLMVLFSSFCFLLSVFTCQPKGLE